MAISSREPHLQCVEPLNQNTRMGMTRMLQGRSRPRPLEAQLGPGLEWAGRMEAFDVRQLLALTHQEYGHCPHPKTLHERLSDIGTHGGR